MKLIILLLMALLAGINSYCQKKAVIKSTGEEVELSDDGTWKYVHDDPSGSVKADTVIASKPKEANYLVKSTKLKYGIWIDKNKWSFANSKQEEDTPSELTFTLKGEDAYGMVVAEKIEIPIENLLEIAIQNAKDASPDLKVIKQECRKVNGRIVHFQHFEGTLQGIKFVYLGYYYSDGNGSVQFLTYTSKNLLDKYRPQMESLLNGFSIME